MRAYTNAFEFRRSIVGIVARWFTFVTVKLSVFVVFATVAVLSFCSDFSRTYMAVRNVQQFVKTVEIENDLIVDDCALVFREHSNRIYNWAGKSQCI